MMQNTGFEKEILNGLLASRKAISPKFLYDEKGSELFESIMKLEEYYPTQAETEILENYASEMAEWIGPHAVVIEPGCGNCMKVRHLLKALIEPVSYVGMDISKEILVREASRLHDEFPHLPVFAVPADYTENFSIPGEAIRSGAKKVVFFPGSTIGNLQPAEAMAWLKKMADTVGKRGGLLIGVDTKKDPLLMNLAYDDPQGVTAEFNLNLLDRLNRELQASFDRRQFYHSAFYDEDKERVEMHLVSKIPQTVKVKDQVIQFEKDETIHTESSYKYSPKEFSLMARRAGFDLKNLWQDSRRLFCVYYFERI
jgi:dimethylhistidine N-methyltransferase